MEQGKKIRVLLCLSWGGRYPHSAGLSNHYMAGIIKQSQLDYDFILIQFDIWHALSDQLFGSAQGFPEYVHVFGQSGRPWTYTVLKEMLDWLKDHQRLATFEQAEFTVLCHKMQWPTVAGILQYHWHIGAKQMQSERKQLEVPYDPDSTHLWARNWLAGQIYRLMSGFVYGVWHYRPGWWK